MRVGPVEELVEQEQQRDRSGRGVCQLTNAGDLRVKPRPSLEQRVLDAKCRADGEGRQRSEAARTGAPASASTALIPTVRSSVLFPDMFDPLDEQLCAGARCTSLRTIRSAGSSGCPSCTPSNSARFCGAVRHHDLRNTSSACSYRYADNDVSASNSAMVSSHAGPPAVAAPPPCDRNRDHRAQELEQGCGRQRDLDLPEQEERQRDDCGVPVAAVDFGVAMEAPDDARRRLAVSVQAACRCRSRSPANGVPAWSAGR